MAKEELMGQYVSGVPHFAPAGMRKWLVVVVAWMTTLAGLAVILRLVSRRIRKQKLWWDDYMIMFSMVWNWVVVGIGFAMFIEGVGYHVDQISEEATRNISKWLLITEIIYVWNLCWTKLSLLFMYYRIFHFPLFKKLVIGAGCFVIAWATTVSFLFIFICVPVEKLWRPELPGHCVSELGIWLANSSSTMFSDILILLLPIRQIWRLQLKKYEKIGLTVVFGLGFFAVFASSFRTWVLFNYSKNDIPYTLAPLLAWSAIEMAAGIISACLPTMRPLLRIVTAKVNSSNLLSFSRTRGSQPSTGANSSNGVRSRQDMAQSGGSADRHDNAMVAPERLQGNAVSTRRNDSPAFYRLPEDIEMGGVFIEEVERASFDGLRTDTKMTFYEEDSGQDSGQDNGHEGEEHGEECRDNTMVIMRVWKG